MADRLFISGAREHNLRDIDLELPRDKLIVFSGLSGSGKSSLAFDSYRNWANDAETALAAAIPETGLNDARK